MFTSFICTSVVCVCRIPKRSSQYEDKRSCMTLCVISDWLYQWLIYTAKCATGVCVCVLWILLICNLLQNRSLHCSCPWDRHARRLSLRYDPKSHFKEDCTILFHTNKSVKIFFWSISFLKNISLWRTLCRNVNCLIKMSLIFTTKI